MQWQKRLREILPPSEKNMCIHFFDISCAREKREKTMRDSRRDVEEGFDARDNILIGLKDGLDIPLSSPLPTPQSTRALRSLELSPVLNFPKKCASKINHFQMWPSNVLFIRKFICSTLFLAFVAVRTPSEFRPWAPPCWK